MYSILVFLTRLVLIINRRVMFSGDSTWYSVEDLKHFFLFAFVQANINFVQKKKKDLIQTPLQRSLGKMND